MLIKDVVFECHNFNTSLLNVDPGDYVYLDPPYAPETEKSFVGYTENGFDKECHETLFKSLHGLTEKNIKFMMSNSDVELVHNNFTNEKYNTLSIMCKRSINSKNPEAKTREVIIKNY
jgi:DNA adenine methylase